MRWSAFKAGAGGEKGLRGGRGVTARVLGGIVNKTPKGKTTHALAVCNQGRQNMQYKLLAAHVSLLSWLSCCCFYLLQAPTW